MNKTCIFIINLFFQIACISGFSQQTNSIGMKMISIPEGKFLMGSAGYGENYDESPAHAVCISKSFKIAATEVTNAQYELFDPEHTALIISGLILFGYWLLCYTLGSKGDPYSLQGYFGTAADKSVLGITHMYKGEGTAFDPEGIVSTLPAIVQVIFGYFVGKYIREKGKTWDMLSHLFIAGSLLIFFGFCWDMVFPINKKIWTSSYVLYTTGLALMVLGVLIYLIEFREAKGAWSRFFDVFGKNPLFIFFLSGFLPRLLALARWADYTDENGKVVYINPFGWFYKHICQPVFENLKNSSLLYALCMVAFFWLIAYLLDRKKIYIKV